MFLSHIHHHVNWFIVEVRSLIFLQYRLAALWMCFGIVRKHTINGQIRARLLRVEYARQREIRRIGIFRTCSYKNASKLPAGLRPHLFEPPAFNPLRYSIVTSYFLFPLTKYTMQSGNAI